MNNIPKIVPVFPISNFIIFPKTTVPLNIFEPRYIDMINDCMKSNKFLGMIQPKKINDENAVDEDGDPILDVDGVQVVNYGLKTNYKNQFNAQAKGLLEKTDWYVIKATDVESYSVPSNIATYRAAVRTKVNAMETSIDGCSDVDALITLLTYTKDSEGVVSRPLGEFPDEVV